MLYNTIEIERVIIIGITTVTSTKIGTMGVVKIYKLKKIVVT